MLADWLALVDADTDALVLADTDALVDAEADSDLYTLSETVSSGL